MAEAAPYSPTCSVLSTSSSTRSIDPHSVKEIQYVLCGPGIFAPPLTLRLASFHYHNLKAACENNLSEVAKVYESGQEFCISGTRLNIKAPKLLENHIFISSPPLICDTNPSSLLVYVYALQVDSNVVSRADIMSHVECEGFCHSLCKKRGYILRVYKPHGHTGDEFHAGTILCLVNTERIESKPNEAIMRGYADVLYVGNESIGVMPPFTAPFQGIERKRSTNCLVQDPLEEEGRDQDVFLHEAQLQDPLQEEGGDQDVVPHEAQLQGPYQVQSQPAPIECQSMSQFVLPARTLPCDTKFIVSGIVPHTMRKKSDIAFPTEEPSFPEIERPILPSDIKDKEHGDLIYAKGSFAEYFPSKKYPHLPKHEDLGKYTIIGQGGNGKVIHYPLANMDLALKYSKCDKTRMEMWAKLHNPHITQLLAVFAIHPVSENWCCQFMPRMTCSLSSEFEKKLGNGGILEALHNNQIQEDVLMPNLCHIFGSLLKALQYLKRINIVHQDFKDSNVLLDKQMCTCDNVYECTCIRKYSVQLCDFDSIVPYYERRSPCPAHSPSPASLDGTKVLGTPEYRAAPEKFLIPSCSCVAHTNFIGPWTDMWSFAVFLLRHLSGNTKDKKIIAEANTLHGIVGEEKFNKKNYAPEIIAPILRLNEVLREVLHNPELYLNSKMVKEMIAMIDMCLVADYKMRATPSQLLEGAFFK